VTRGDQQLVVTLEHEGEREGAAQLLERRSDGHLGIKTAVELACDP
jgi:hypothetical protein